MPRDTIRVTPVPDPPYGYTAEAIDELFADGASVTIRQTDKHSIALDIATHGETRHFRFQSTTPDKGAGICLRNSQEPPPGSQTPTPGYPDEIAAYNLRKGHIHIEMMDPNRYWIGIGAGPRGGSLEAVTRSARSGNITLTPTGQS